MIQIAYISDEISRNLEFAVRFASLFGLAHCELRNVFSGRVAFDLTNVEESRLIDSITASDHHVVAISPGIGKQYLTEGFYESNFDLLTRAITIAKLLQCSEIIIFGFRRQKGSLLQKLPDEAASALNRLAELAHVSGIRLVLENHPSCYVATSEQLLGALIQIGHPNIRLNWDPANSFLANNEPASGQILEDLLPYLNSVHIKDINFARKGTKLFSGAVGWENILKSLIKSGCQCRLTLEPHRPNKLVSFAADAILLKRFLLRVSGNL